MLKLRLNYAEALHDDPSATLDDVREAWTTIEDVGRIARRVLGGAHPVTEWAEKLVRITRENASSAGCPVPHTWGRS